MNDLILRHGMCKAVHIIILEGEGDASSRKVDLSRKTLIAVSPVCMYVSLGTQFSVVKSWIFPFEKTEKHQHG